MLLFSALKSKSSGSLFFSLLRLLLLLLLLRRCLRNVADLTRRWRMFYLSLRIHLKLLRRRWRWTWLPRKWCVHRWRSFLQQRWRCGCLLTSWRCFAWSCNSAERLSERRCIISQCFIRLGFLLLLRLLNFLRSTAERLCYCRCQGTTFHGLKEAPQYSQKRATNCRTRTKEP